MLVYECVREEAEEKVKCGDEMRLTGRPLATAVTRCCTSVSWEMRALALAGSMLETFISSVSLILGALALRIE